MWSIGFVTDITQMKRIKTERDKRQRGEVYSQFCAAAVDCWLQLGGGWREKGVCLLKHTWRRGAAPQTRPASTLALGVCR